MRSYHPCQISLRPGHPSSLRSSPWSTNTPQVSCFPRLPFARSAAIHAGINAARVAQVHRHLPPSRSCDFLLSEGNPSSSPAHTYTRLAIATLVPLPYGFYLCELHCITRPVFHTCNWAVFCMRCTQLLNLKDIVCVAHPCHGFVVKSRKEAFSLQSTTVSVRLQFLLVGAVPPTAQHVSHQLCRSRCRVSVALARTILCRLLVHHRSAWTVVRL